MAGKAGDQKERTADGLGEWDAGEVPGGGGQNRQLYCSPQTKALFELRSLPL